MKKEPLQPVQPDERIAALDVVRGFALFGVLLAYTVWSLGSPPAQTYGSADRILNGVFSGLIDTKFYTLLAFLFGLGFSIQLRRASERGVSIVAVYCRRLLVLMAIGLAHALLLRNGDILVPYAVMGFVLLLFRRASNTALAIGGFLALLFPYLARTAWDFAGVPFPQRPETAGLSYLADNYAWVRYWYSTAITSWPASLPMFLFGLYMGRVRFFENAAAKRASLRTALVMGLAGGLLAFIGAESLRYLWANSSDSFMQRLSIGLLWSLHAWALAAFYLSSLLLLWQKPVWQRALAPLGAVGRMTLTNYLLQAAIVVPACIVLDLFDRVTPSLGLMLALAVWSLQVLASIWWLRHFHFGPAEWVWRTLAYGHAQPMRVATRAKVVVDAPRTTM